MRTGDTKKGVSGEKARPQGGRGRHGVRRERTCLATVVKTCRWFKHKQIEWESESVQTAKAQQ